MNFVTIISAILALLVIVTLYTDAAFVSPGGRVESPDVNDSGWVPLIVNDQLQFIGNISIGTPPQNIVVLFDMSSTSLIVSNGSYDANASSTALGAKVPGLPGIDNVIIGGFNIPNQIFQISESINGSISSDESIEGIFGLGYVANNIASPMSNLLEQELLEDQLFSIHWTQKLNVSLGTAELMLGFFDTAVYHGQLVYVNVTDLSSWQFQLDSASINGILASNSSQVVLNTTSNAIAVPTSVFSSLQQYLQIQPNENNVSYPIPCNSDSTLFEFVISNSTFSLNASDFILLSTPSSNSSIVPSDNDTTMCVFNIQDSGSDHWSLGTPFLIKYYSVYDIENKRIGLAESIKVPIYPEEPSTITTMPTTTTTTQDTVTSTTMSPGNSAQGSLVWRLYQKLMLLIVVVILLLK